MRDAQGSAPGEDPAMQYARLLGMFGLTAKHEFVIVMRACCTVVRVEVACKTFSAAQVSVLGAGGFASVMLGLWRGSVMCAVKIFVTSPRPPPNARLNTKGPAEAGCIDHLTISGLPHPAVVTGGMAVGVQQQQQQPVQVQQQASASQPQGTAPVQSQVDVPLRMLVEAVLVGRCLGTTVAGLWLVWCTWS